MKTYTLKEYYQKIGRQQAGDSAISCYHSFDYHCGCVRHHDRIYGPPWVEWTSSSYLAWEDCDRCQGKGILAIHWKEVG